MKCYDNKICKYKKGKYYSWKNCSICNKYKKWEDKILNKKNINN